tara:strand:- start:517 stop:1026 length:510 start_codon:yes stop_codon:yes gene_type:complete
MYKLIVAFDINRGIGLKNNLPWKIKEDMQKFVNLSKKNGKNAIIMGKNTWLSLPNKPLKNRYNIVLSTTLDKNIILPETTIFNNIDNIVKFCNNNKFEEIWIIGGEKIYNLFLEKDLVDEIYITHIEKEYNCDTFFPELSNEKWNLIKFDNIFNNDIKANISNKIYKKK